MDILPELKKSSILYVLGTIVSLIIFYFFFFSSPLNFPPGAIVNIEKGSSLRSVSLILKNEHIIRSRVAFESFAIIVGGDRHIQAGGYLFENKVSVWQVALRIARGEHHLPPVSVTIPEGFTVNQIADTFRSRLLDFNKEQFLTEAKDKEGYLFPDTYFFLTTDTEKEVIDSMERNFEKKISLVATEINSSGKTEREIIIMASLLEGEAKGEIDRGIISGILWKRISIGMPLQVDAAPETYKTKGLPKNAIGNPGMLSIKAALYPQSSPYLYYLHDKNGTIYYAKNFAEHRKNVLQYLK